MEVTNFVSKVFMWSCLLYTSQENKLNLENVNAKLNEIQTLSNHISRLQHLKDNHQKAVEAARNALDLSLIHI